MLPKATRPGGQHDVDQRYLQRIEALNFTIQHDDGQALETLDDAEVVLAGASWTSKTPTCVYLAIRGVRAANVPIVPAMPLPPQLLRAKKPLIVGLWASPDRLVQVRRNRLIRWAKCVTQVMWIWKMSVPKFRPRANCSSGRIGPRSTCHVVLWKKPLLPSSTFWPSARRPSHDPTYFGVCKCCACACA